MTRYKQSKLLSKAFNLLTIIKILEMRAFKREMQSQSLQKKPIPLKQWARKEQIEEEDQYEQLPLHNMHQLPKTIQSGVTGVNGIVETYVVTEAGTSGGKLWSLNLSTLPGQQKRLMTVNAASTFLLNYASNQYPGKINIMCNEVYSTKDHTGALSRTIGALVPAGAPTTISNGGGVIGFNIGYSLMCTVNPVEITGIPLLTFDVSTNSDTTVAQYPLAEPITFIVQITRVIF